MLDVPSGHPGHPPLRAPGALLRWVGARAWPLLVVATILAAVESLAAVAAPGLLGRALDAGLAGGLSDALLLAALGLLAVGLIEAAGSAAGHVGEVGAWMHGAFTTTRLVGHHVTRTGAAIGKDLPTGEVVATVATDAWHVGNVFELLPRFLAGLVGYIAVAVLVLGESRALGLLILLGMPVVSLVLALVVKPLQARQFAHREASGKLSTLASDTVAGLRVLRGIGGEDVFAARYRRQSQAVRRAGIGVAATQSILAGLQVLLPGLLTITVVWFGAHLAMRGEITAGQLVTFYGYTVLLAQPLRWATQFLQFAIRARVSARKMIRVLSVQPAAGTLAESEAADARPVAPPAASAGPEITDESSGITFLPGRLTAVVSERPEESAALALRLGRFDDDETPVRLGAAALADLPVAEVRDRVVVSDATPQLFTGTLRDELDVRDRADDAELFRALEVADAHDVLEALPEGLDGEITEKGRSLSGGQRQRVALARALLTEPETLVLIEPTSAVDAHTEARIAARLAEYRRGRTTVLVTASPLVLEHADEVVFLDGGRERARGPHRELLARAAAGEPNAVAYHRVVNRQAEPITEEVR